MTAEERIDQTLDLVMNGVPDDDHHKMWLLDQMVRTLTGCPVITKTAQDHNGAEYTYSDLGESNEYRDFVRRYEEGEDGPHTYTWRTGIAP